MKPAKTPHPDREAELHAAQSSAILTCGVLALVLLTAGFSSSEISWSSTTGILFALGTASATLTWVSAWFFLRRQYYRGRNAESAFRATMAILKGFFDSTPMRMGVVEVLPDNIRHVWDNPAAAMHYGTTPIGLEDKLETDLGTDLKQVALWITGYATCLEKGEPVHFKFDRRQEGGMRHWYSATVFPISWMPGRDRHCAYMCQDITDLVEARAQAEEASRAKSVFLAHMSHELRTPLNSVIGFAGILLKQWPENAPGPSRTYLQRIRENGRHLLDLISDILDHSKIEMGKVELHPEPVQLSDLIGEVSESCEPLFHEKGLRLEQEGFENPLLPLSCDRGKLRQILVNLVGNAVKFTHSGGVQIRLVRDPQGLPLAVEVIDSGIGIPQEHLDSIFEPFRQGDGSVARKYGGSGLGLSISRALAEQMGFRITVESAVGSGSAFRVEFSNKINETASEIQQAESVGR